MEEIGFVASGEIGLFQIQSPWLYLATDNHFTCHRTEIYGLFLQTVEE